MAYSFLIGHIKTRNLHRLYMYNTYIIYASTDVTRFARCINQTPDKISLYCQRSNLETLNIYNYSVIYLSASNAAIHPDPAAVIACLYIFVFVLSVIKYLALSVSCCSFKNPVFGI